MMHAATMDSPRLQRALAVLRDGRAHTTRDLVVEAHICAVNSVVAELRANGIDISCRQGVDVHGGRVWLYQLANREESPAGPGAAETATGSPGNPLPGGPPSPAGSELAIARGSARGGA